MKSRTTPAAQRLAPTPEARVAQARSVTRPPIVWPNVTVNRVVVSIAPPQRYGNRSPSSCGNVAAKCAASVLERRRPLVELGRNAVAGW